jgi:hypothetical protein
MGGMDAGMEISEADQLAAAEDAYELADDQLERAQLRGGVVGWFSVRRATRTFDQAEQNLRDVSGAEPVPIVFLDMTEDGI